MGIFNMNLGSLVIIFATSILKQACDILIGELSDRFEQEDVMKPLLCMKSILLKSACG